MLTKVVHILLYIYFSISLVYDLSKYYQVDGLSSVEYEVTFKETTKLFSIISVHIPGPKAGAEEAKQFLIQKTKQFEEQYHTH